MIYKLLWVCALIAASATLTWAASQGTISGKAADTAGKAVNAATVTVTDLTSGAIVHVTTEADGSFRVTNLAPDRYLVTVQKSGLNEFDQVVSLMTQESATVQATMTVATLAQSVVVRGTVMPGATATPSREDVLLSNQTIRVLDRKAINAAGPVAGGAQMIALTPGANVFGYSNNGAAKYSIQLNGISQGWAGEQATLTSPGSLGVTYDGIPVADVATGLWQSATMPQNLLIQNVNVTYGPGSPDQRWYTNIGGGVEFVPVQPKVSQHFTISGSYGSFNQKNLAFVYTTGALHGWSTVIAGGVGNGDSFRTASDGFKNPTKDGAVYAKTVRTFSAGSLELGAYYARSGGWRPQTIPTSDQGVIIPGTDVSYSQPTSGFYSTLPFADYRKYDVNELWTVYARENMVMNSTTTFTNTSWYMHIFRFHRKDANIFDNSPTELEWNDPHSNAYGDKLALTKILPYNTATIGGYYIHELYNSKNNFYQTNPEILAANGCAPDALGAGSGINYIANCGGHIRSGLFNQDDAAFFFQDDIRPIPQLHITPGVRLVWFQMAYADNALRDFTLAPNVVPTTHCSFYAPGAGSDPFYNIYPGTNTDFGTTNTVKDQGSICSAHEGRLGVEPSINVSVLPVPWLNIYGGYDVSYHAPTDVGGGGGMFQQVDPQYYQLAKGIYTQFGVKVHFRNAPLLRNFLFGAAYYHIDYNNQAIEQETANGLYIIGGGDSRFHGVNAYFDADPLGNLHVFANFNGESSKFTNYIQGGVSAAECAAAPTGTCTFYNNLPIPYTPNLTANFGVYYGVEYNDHLLFEPRLTFKAVGAQHMWDNCTTGTPTGIVDASACGGGSGTSTFGGPSTATMPGYGTLNLTVNVPIHKYINLTASVLNLLNRKYNEFEYISAGGYFITDNAGYINAYPAEPISAYGTISFQF